MQIKALASETVELKAGMEALASENVELKAGVEELKVEVNKLKSNQQHLIVGQIAFLVDEAILRYVMNGIDDPNNRWIYTISHLEKAIKREEQFADALSDNERETASDRWKKLKSNLGWQGKHYRSLKHLKKKCLDFAHPTVDESELKEAIDKVCFHDYDLKTICNEFFDMLKKIRQASL